MSTEAPETKELLVNVPWSDVYHSVAQSGRADDLEEKLAAARAKVTELEEIRVKANAAGSNVYRAVGILDRYAMPIGFDDASVTLLQVAQKVADEKQETEKAIDELSQVNGRPEYLRTIKDKLGWLAKVLQRQSKSIDDMKEWQADACENLKQGEKSTAKLKRIHQLLIDLNPELYGASDATIDETVKWVTDDFRSMAARAAEPRIPDPYEHEGFKDGFTRLCKLIGIEGVHQVYEVPDACIAKLKLDREAIQERINTVSQHLAEEYTPEGCDMHGLLVALGVRAGIDMGIERPWRERLTRVFEHVATLRRDLSMTFKLLAAAKDHVPEHAVIVIANGITLDLASTIDSHLALRRSSEVLDGIFENAVQVPKAPEQDQS